MDRCPEQHTAYGATTAKTSQGCQFADPHFRDSLGTPELSQKAHGGFSAVSIISVVFIPWVFFAAVYVPFSYLAYDSSVVGFLLPLAALLPIMALGCFIYDTYQQDVHRPAWALPLFLNVCLTWILAMIFGSLNAHFVGTKYHDMKSLVGYTGINPSNTTGQQLLDAGSVTFLGGSRIDRSRSMGFKKGTVYCVAPVTRGSLDLMSYDFWFVGKDCCSPTGDEYHCNGVKRPTLSGIRLAEQDQQFYRLAVREAVAKHKITSMKPLLFYYVEDPENESEEVLQRLHHNVIAGLTAYLAFQVFIVVTSVVCSRQVEWRWSLRFNKKPEGR